MLRVSRLSGKAIPKRGDVGYADVDHRDVTDIHPLVFGLLMSMYPCPGELRRVLAQDWVRMWAGWIESSAMIASASDAQEENQIAEDVVVRSSRISIDNVHERFMSDQDRQVMLLDEGLILGKGEAHGASNSRLSDSLLQLLIWHNVISKPLFDSSNAEKKWQQHACAAVRAHLCNHDEVALQPRQRDSTSAIVQDATAEEHALVYLNAHAHSAGPGYGLDIVSDIL